MTHVESGIKAIYLTKADITLHISHTCDDPECHLRKFIEEFERS